MRCLHRHPYQKPFNSQWIRVLSLTMKPLTTALLFSEAAESQKNGISVHSELTVSFSNVLMFLPVTFIQ